jgi:O-antigen/teichoic acid export membrane protein
MNIDKIKSQVLSILLNRGLIAFFSLLLEIILIKYLTVEEKGEIFYMRANIELFALIFSFGLGISIVHFRSKYGNIYDRQIIRWIGISLVSLLLMSMLLYHNASVVKYLFINKDYYISAIFASIFTLLIFYLQKLFLSEDNIKVHNQVVFYSKVSVISVLILIATFIETNKVLFLISSIPVSLLAVTLFFSMKLKLNHRNKEVNYQFKKYSLKVYLFELIFQVKTKFDNFIILYFLGVSAVGIFSVAASFGALILIVSNSIVLILLKEMSKNINFMLINSLYKKYIILISGLIVLTIIGLYIIIKLVSPEKFDDSIIVFLVYSISLFFMSLNVFFQAFFNSIGKVNTQILSIIFSLLPYLVIPFINIQDIFEILLIINLSNFMQCCYYYFLYKKEINA